MKSVWTEAIFASKLYIYLHCRKSQ